MQRYIKHILAQVVIVTASLLGATACTPNKVVVDQGASTIEFQRDSGGATSVRVTPRDDPNPVRPKRVVPTPLAPAAADQAPQVDDARRELAAVLTERDQAVETRDKTTVAVDQAQRSVASLSRQIEQLGTAKAAIEKELAELAARKDKTRAEVGETQSVADALAAEIKSLTAAKATMEQERAAVAANLGRAKDTLVSVSADVVAREKQLSELKKQQINRDAALTAARTALDRATTDTAKATANLGNLGLQIENRKRELADLAARREESGGSATPPATRFGKATPDVESAGGGHAGWPTLPIAIGVVAIIVGAAVAALIFMTRKPATYSFTLLDEDSKVSHRLQLTTGERVDLSGSQPVKKAGGANGHAPFLTVDPKGRLLLHAMTGFVTKLNDRLVNTVDNPVVQAGTVLELTANGLCRRLLVGPVLAVKQGHNAFVKSAPASVRPA